MEYLEYSVQDVLGWLAPVSGRLVNQVEEADLPELRVGQASELSRARRGDIAFFFSRSYQAELMQASPGILVTGEPFVKPLQASGLPLWKRTAVIACSDPYLGMALCLERIAADQSSVVHSLDSKNPHSPPSMGPIVHPSAVVSPGAKLGVDVRIGPQCTIEEGASIGDGTVLYAGCYLGVGAAVGKACVLFPRVTLYEWTVVGDRVRIHAGAVLGADGFGYAPLQNASGEPTGHKKISHLGRVVIGDDVEIGANTCIDRGTLGDTRIEHQVKIDDLVMIGHNCWIEEGAILCGKAGLAGRARVGKYAMIGGAAGLSNDVYVGDRARVGGHCLVSKDVPSGATVVGNPQREHKEHFRVQAMLNRMMATRKRGTEEK
jgi:UDP-3-O-[3-hydroxymyristoyl] glucosamine N-acyltransferase LpxD